MRKAKKKGQCIMTSIINTGCCCRSKLFKSAELISLKRSLLSVKLGRLGPFKSSLQWNKKKEKKQKELKKKG